jgi:lysophospholipase L1-like esterase
MPDLLHLSPKGYQLWAEAIEPHVARLMGEQE